MKVLYFSSTGNCLYVAKRTGGECLAIPTLIEKGADEFRDDVVGVIFPVYGLCIPPYVEEFLKKITVECKYFFAIATYGFFSGAVCRELAAITTKNGRKFDYVNRIKMAENCITFADMAKQKGDSEKQQKAISEVLADVNGQKRYQRKDSFFHKMMTDNHKKNFEYPTGVGITEEITITGSCASCGLCARVCPTNNITMKEGRPVFGKNCVSCGGCMQNCSQNAIHHRKEKSGARYRNPHVTTKELVLR